MNRYFRKRKETIGLSPDAVLFQGEKKIDFTRLRFINYDETNLEEFEIKSIDEVINQDNTKSTSWLNIDGVHDEKIMRKISKAFNLESFIIADIMNTHARPKIHEYDDCIFISAKMLYFDTENEELYSENLVLVLKENMLFSFQERVGDVFEPVRNRIRRNTIRIRTSGTAYLAFALLDIVIDNYIYALGRIAEKIEFLDEELITNPSKDKLEEINKYNREIHYLRRIIKPGREMILNLIKTDSNLIPESLFVHFKELQNNINMANESVDSYREMLSDQLSFLHTNLSNKLNDILKFLTIFSVIFIPITFIAGIYGTNFDNIPELHFKWGYFYMWGLILTIVFAMTFYFKRKKWF